jgi:hypothetical protein
MLAVDRAVSKFRDAPPGTTLYFHNPIPVALFGLSTPYSAPMLSSFLEGGGVSTVTQLVAKSKCPLTVGRSAALVTVLLDDVSQPEGQRLLDELLQSGARCGLDGRKNPFFIMTEWMTTIPIDISVDVCSSCFHRRDIL